MGSPLGKYAQAVAAVVAVGVIAAAVAVRVAGIGADPFLDNLALLATGAVFGSAAATNGIKPDVIAANVRLDAIGAPPAKEAEKIAVTRAESSVHTSEHDG